MSTEQTLLDLVIQISIVISSGLTLLCGYRVIKGPTVPDRMVALDTVSTNIVAIGALTALMTGKGYFILISLVLTNNRLHINHNSRNVHRQRRHNNMIEIIQTATIGTNNYRIIF